MKSKELKFYQSFKCINLQMIENYYYFLSEEGYYANFYEN